MLEIINVSKKYNRKSKSENSKKEVLENISFSINDGEFVSIVGPSGCGKTTLINLIMGLEKPSSGQILINGEKVGGIGHDRALVFQENALFPWLTVKENIELGLKVKKIKKAERDAIANHYLDVTNLTEFKDYNIHQLSGGMKQRVAIARALAIESQILVMDEPFGALDLSTKHVLHGEILKIWKETGKTIIFVTHDVTEAVMLAEKVIVLGYSPNNIKKIIPIELGYPRTECCEITQYINTVKQTISENALI